MRITYGAEADAAYIYLTKALLDPGRDSRRPHSRRRTIRRQASTLALAGLASFTATACHSAPTCQIPSPPAAGSHGAVLITRGSEAGGSLATTFGGREWATPMPSLAATTHIHAHALVISINHQARLRVTTADGHQNDLQLIGAGCA